MPMKWTPENDQRLLLKILETSNVTADVQAIAKGWANDYPGIGPTARAVTERLVKIRAQCKANGGGHFAVASAQSKGKAATKNIEAPKTPRKKAQSEASNTTPPSGATATASGSKRKRRVVEDEDDDFMAQDPVVIKDEPDIMPPNYNGDGSFNSYAPTLDDSDNTPPTPSGIKSLALAQAYSLPNGFNTSPKRSKGNAGQPVVRDEIMEMPQYATSQGYQNDIFMATPAAYPAFEQQEEEEEYEDPVEV